MSTLSFFFHTITFGLFEKKPKRMIDAVPVERRALITKAVNIANAFAERKNLKGVPSQGWTILFLDSPKKGWPVNLGGQTNLNEHRVYIIIKHATVYVTTHEMLHIVFFTNYPTEKDQAKREATVAAWMKELGIRQ